MSDTTITGSIKALSIHNKGIRVGDAWFNWLPDLNEFCAKLQKGQTVEITADHNHTIKNLSLIDGEIKTSEEFVGSKEFLLDNGLLMKTFVEEEEKELDKKYNNFIMEYKVMFRFPDTVGVGGDSNYKILHKLTVFYKQKI